MIAAAVEKTQEPDFRFADDIKETVRKTVKIHTAHIGKADSIKQRVVWKRLDAAFELALQFSPQAGTPVFIPVIGFLQISAQEWMSFERAHGRIHGTSAPRRLA